MTIPQRLRLIRALLLLLLALTVIALLVGVQGVTDPPPPDPLRGVFGPSLSSEQLTARDVLEAP